MKKLFIALILTASFFNIGCQYDESSEEQIEVIPPLEQYTVTFVMYDGQPPIPMTGVTGGSLIAEPEEPSRPGYAFLGWHKSASPNPWNFTTDTVVKNTNLFAHWTPLPLTTGTIHYIDIEGGFFGIITDTGMKLDPVNLKDEFKKDGLRVSFSYLVKSKAVSIHMWGLLIEINQIVKIGDIVQTL